ncbi:MAG TPA: phosphoribosylanthranilate isomerase [Longimicrobiales bacterium]|nr:phosphoribosylanthranilate isomerase [Longimicrobiales bacterium]
MKVKICGVCRPEDAVAAVSAGADCVGVILAPGGKRSQTPERAAEILRAVSDGGRAVARVGVFVDSPAGEVIETARRLSLDIVQLHGNESPAAVKEVRASGLTAWKAIRVRDRDAFLSGLELYGTEADALLLDGWAAHAAGGAGVRFDWDAIAPVRSLARGVVPLWVAGGLAPDTVADAIRILDPEGVDVSSGVESEPGVKDHALIAAFIRAAREARAVAPTPGRSGST